MMFHVQDVSFPEFLWSKDWPKPQAFRKQNRKHKHKRDLTVFLSPDKEIVSQLEIVSRLVICALLSWCGWINALLH